MVTPKSTETYNSFSYFLKRNERKDVGKRASEWYLAPKLIKMGMEQSIIILGKFSPADVPPTDILQQSWSEP